MRIGILELLVIVVVGFVLLTIALVFGLRRRKPAEGFPVLPPAPPEAEEPRARGH
jgi:LPXTG-motif cell wall-anchored protein